VPVASLGSAFSYHRYISKVKFSDLVESNKVVNEAWVGADESLSGCVLCGKRSEGQSAVRLNSGGLVCKSCFEGLQYVYFPETYQQRHVDYTVAKEARRIARREFEDAHHVAAEVRRAARTQHENAHPSTAAASRLRKARRAAGWSIAGDIAVGGGLGLLTSAGTPVFWILAAALLATLVGVLAVISGVSRRHLAKLAGDMSRWDETNPDPLAMLARDMSQWDEANPDPPAPELRQFHDPQAFLTERDRRLLQIFDYWPGYPPFWSYVRSVVLDADEQRCQVTGCPSRTTLHIHHMRPVSEGGSHRPDNLVTLCEFHHGLCPESGHERVWGQISTMYFTMVRAHLRNGHPVNAHVRRLELATQEQLERIGQYHGMVCSKCQRPGPRISVDYDRNTVQTYCPACKRQAEFDQKLLEENGPWLAAHLRARNHIGRWHDDSRSMQSERTPVGRRRGELAPSRVAGRRVMRYPGRRRW
jgi:hypothetical protein